MYKIIIVEDDDYMREEVVNLFDWNSLGIEIAGCACNGLEGILIAKETKPHIVLTDILMPKLNGLQMSKEIKNILPDSLIILLSEYKNFQFAQQSFEFNAFSYLLKPIQKNILNDTLIRAVGILSENDRKALNVRSLEKQCIDLNFRNSEFVLLDFLEGRIPIRYIQRLMLDNVGFQDGKNLVVITSLFPKAKTIDTSKLGNKHEQVQFLNSIEELLSEIPMLMVHSKPFDELVICFKSPVEIDSLREILLDLKNKLKNMLGIESLFAIGESVDGIINLPHSYLQAREVLKYSCLAEYGDLLFYQDFYNTKSMLWDIAAPLLLQSKEIIENLKYCFQIGRHNDCINIVDTFLTTLKKEKFAGKIVLKSFVLDFLKEFDMLLIRNSNEYIQDNYNEKKLI